ncbi:type II CAAX endopeptidase family protein [Candidatus Rhabdochlamydia sp. T3358]|uniref:CPBP family intramembrane glutamic endopeptidase n=1 Tax=Candidatus Rhabdochlamydia sp. T3358 TaxID=2099795 RepID=UPI0010AF4620|nr:type II CAAX endopeptidase family protein [Candidatus Rhabdochlamydia sp. T3358]VHO04921.1 CAAX amino terminal protease self- immunity [Candidatus Rhabdochlamydia sp. T3358]
MQISSFSYEIFIENPLFTLCFFTLGISLMSLWVCKKWFWAIFLFIAYFLALYTHIATTASLIPIILLGVCQYALKKTTNPSIRFLLFGSAVFISISLFMHFLPGFANWKIVSDLTIGKNSYPLTLWLNFDKPFIGLFVLAYLVPLIESRENFWGLIKKVTPVLVLMIFSLAAVSYYLKAITFDPKLPAVFLIWAIQNLIFVSIPEEAFFRGFFQQELDQSFGLKPLGTGCSIIITSILFALLHIGWSPNFSAIALTFCASLFYGVVYRWTQAIEASIFCHFGFNTVHFLFFSYPFAIQPGL